MTFMPLLQLTSISSDTLKLGLYAGVLMLVSSPPAFHLRGQRSWNMSGNRNQCFLFSEVVLTVQISINLECHLERTSCTEFGQADLGIA